MVNFPHNPTGISLSVEEQKELVNISARAGAYLVWDAAFADITYKKAPLPYPSLQYERAISIGTLSKSYGLPGLRLGWILGPPDILSCATHLRDYITAALFCFRCRSILPTPRKDLFSATRSRDLF